MLGCIKNKSELTKQIKAFLNICDVPFMEYTAITAAMNIQF